MEYDEGASADYEPPQNWDEAAVEMANRQDFRAEMIEAGLGDPDEWDWADIAATRAIDEERELGR